MNFTYVAFDIAGDEHEGVIEAVSPEDAVRLLREMGLFVVRVASYAAAPATKDLAKVVDTTTPGRKRSARKKMTEKESVECAICRKVAVATRTAYGFNPGVSIPAEYASIASPFRCRAQPSAI